LHFVGEGRQIERESERQKGGGERRNEERYGKLLI
jgi:hypothetical protein